MSVQLRPLTEDNWEECIKLTVANEHQNFVAPNVYSIAQSRFEPTWVPLAIYNDDTMVGFLMYDSADYELVRLMVDQHHQGKGYGAAAMRLLLEHFEREYACPTTKTTFVPGNTVAEQLYLKLGYEKTGELKEGEIVVRRQFHRRT
jgi:diamine N-acetyltransferase